MPDIDESLIPELRAAIGPFTVFVGEMRDGFQIRRDAADSEGDITFTGTAAVFDQLSDELGGRGYSFREKIAHGFFRKMLDEQQDTVFLYDHDGLVLARTVAGTLDLAETPRGLQYDARSAPTTVAQDLAIAMRAGNVRHSSFAFSVAEDKWEENYHEDGTVEVIRTLIEGERLFDVSAVGQPAYPQTDVSVRSRAMRQVADRYGLDLPDPTDAFEELAQRMASTGGEGREVRKARLSELQAGATRRLSLEKARTTTRRKR